MLRTIVLLLLSLIALPIVAFWHDAPLQASQWAMIAESSRLMLGVALLCFLTSEMTRNYSQVDKLWSIVPVVYAVYFAWASGWDARLTLMALLVAAWGIRLTYNFARRGGYAWPLWRGEEDYRWSVLREMPLLQGRLRWGLFNFIFISLYQNTLIWLITLPSVVAFAGRGKPLQAYDFALALLFLALLVIETIADQQQYDFQTEKYRRKAAGEPLEGEYAQGFRSSGLWAWVRHPNYAAEQGIWLTFYLFSVAATGRWLNWSLAGGILLMLLFLGSSDFSEKISAGKYPAYRDYKGRVPRFVPGL
jgi:steroid 5-alpha reductase family enzyme